MAKTGGGSTGVSRITLPNSVATWHGEALAQGWVAPAAAAVPLLRVIAGGRLG